MEGARWTQNAECDDGNTRRLRILGKRFSRVFSLSMLRSLWNAFRCMGLPAIDVAGAAHTKQTINASAGSASRFFTDTHLGCPVQNGGSVDSIKLP